MWKYAKVKNVSILVIFLQCFVHSGCILVQQTAFMYVFGSAPYDIKIINLKCINVISIKRERMESIIVTN